VAANAPPGALLSEMLLPTLQALDHLGGSGSKDEIDQEVILHHGTDRRTARRRVPPEATQKGSKVIHRLAWARTYLKKFGAVDNSRRGVWTLEPPGRQYIEMDLAQAAKALRTADYEVRRQSRARRVETGVALGLVDFWERAERAP
jgi:restriction system protein